MPKPKKPAKTKAKTNAKTNAPVKPTAKPPTKAEVEAVDKVIRRVTGADQEGTGKWNHLPLVSSLFEDNKEMQRAITCLETAHRLRDEIEKAEKGWEDGDSHVMGLGETKDEITAITLGAEVAGYRYGTLATMTNLLPGRRTLNKDKLRQLLVDEGVDPTRVGKIIDEAHVEGDSYYRVEFKKLT